MKKIVPVLLLIFAAIAACEEHVEDKLAKYGKECQEETGITDEHTQKLRNGIFEDGPKVRESVFCFHKKTGFINEEGVVQTETIEEKLKGTLGEENVEKILTKCKDIKGSTPKDTAFDFFKCFNEQKKELKL